MAINGRNEPIARFDELFLVCSDCLTLWYRFSYLDVGAASDDDDEPVGLLCMSLSRSLSLFHS